MDDFGTRSPGGSDGAPSAVERAEDWLRRAAFRSRNTRVLMFHTRMRQAEVGRRLARLKDEVEQLECARELTRER